MARKRKPDRLDIEAKKATDAGMSYGKWKALQKPEKPAPAPKPKNLTEVKCEYCGKVFYQSDNRHRKYCVDCRMKADYGKRRDGAKKWRAEHIEQRREYYKKWREANREYC